MAGGPKNRAVVEDAKAKARISWSETILIIVNMEEPDISEKHLYLIYHKWDETPSRPATLRDFVIETAKR